MTMILFLELLFQKLLFKNRFENQKKWCIICLSYSKHIKEDPKVQHRWKQNVVLTSLITWSDSDLTFCFCMSNTLH